MSFPVLPFRMPPTVLAGAGAAEQIGEEAKRLGGRRALLVADPGVVAGGSAAKIEKLLAAAGLEVRVFSEVKPEPAVSFMDSTVAAVRREGAELVVGLGGGSALDCSKMIAALLANPGSVADYFGIGKIPRRGPPLVLLPTTAGTGSEFTPIAIFTDTAAGLKKGVVSPHLIADVAIVDPELTVSCPPAVTAATGMDALTHAIEAYTAVKATPLTDIHAAEAVFRAARSLRRAVADGADLPARTDMSLASMMAGVALANAGVGAVHALAYPLGGRFGAPHGAANALLLPAVMERNLSGNFPKFAEVARLLGEPVAGLSAEAAARAGAAAVARLARDVGIPERMSQFKVTAGDIPEMARQAFENRRLMDNNPRPLSLDEIAAIYREVL
jgi:alcohol dehydrogenase class IV